MPELKIWYRTVHEYLKCCCYGTHLGQFFVVKIVVPTYEYLKRTCYGACLGQFANRSFGTKKAMSIQSEPVMVLSKSGTVLSMSIQKVTVMVLVWVKSQPKVWYL